MNFLKYTAIANKPKCDKLIYEATGVMPRSTNETYYYLSAIAKETGEKGMIKILEYHPDYNMFHDYFKEKFENAENNKNNNNSQLSITPINVTGIEEPVKQEVKSNNENSNLTDIDRKFMWSTNMVLLGAVTLISAAIILRK